MNRPTRCFKILSTEFLAELPPWVILLCIGKLTAGSDFSNLHRHSC